LGTAITIFCLCSRRNEYAEARDNQGSLKPLFEDLRLEGGGDWLGVDIQMIGSESWEESFEIRADEGDGACIGFIDYD
jgi:hypothetical protein